MSFLITSDEYLEIRGVPLHTPAWVVNDLSPAWDVAKLRGEDRIIPFSDGQLPLPRVRDEMDFEVPITVFGDMGADGSTFSDARIGLWLNTRYLETVLGIPETSDSDDGTMSLILHAPDSSLWVASCFVIPPFNWSPVGPGVVRGILRVIVPTGFLSESS